MSIGKKFVMTVGILGFGSLFIVPVSVGVVGALFSGNSCTAASSVTLTDDSQLTGASAEAYLAGFSKDEQTSMLGIATEIYKVGATRQPAESTRAIIIAIATAIQESNLTNEPEGDADSHGVFQQQPAQGWGTQEEVTNVDYATNAFFDAYDRVANPDSMAMIDVAIAVQNPSRDAYHSRWNWDKTAAEILAQVAAPGANESCVSTGWQLPLKADVYSISDPYGMRFHPIFHVWRLHDGVDLAADEGTPVYAASSGVIAFVGDNGGYGNYISINHSGGVLTGYGHLSAFADGIHKDMQVTTGQLIGYVGSTGDSTGFHLHFLLHVDGKSTDPIPFMKGEGISIEDGATG